MKVVYYTYDKPFNGILIDNPANSDVYYVIEYEGETYIQNVVPFVDGVKPITNKNKEEVVEKHKEKILEMHRQREINKYKRIENELKDLKLRYEIYDEGDESEEIRQYLTSKIEETKTKLKNELNILVDKYGNNILKEIA